MVITYKSREQVYAGIVPDTEKQVYHVPSPKSESESEGSVTRSFESVEVMAEQFAAWLTDRSYDLPTTPERGTVAYYIYQEALAEMVYVHCQDTGEQFREWLIPELIGYEGKTLEVVDKWGETQRFKLAATGIWALQHTKVVTGCGYFPPVIGDPFQSIKVITSELSGE